MNTLLVLRIDLVVADSTDRRNRLTEGFRAGPLYLVHIAMASPAVRCCRVAVSPGKAVYSEPVLRRHALMTARTCRLGNSLRVGELVVMRMAR